MLFYLGLRVAQISFGPTNNTLSAKQCQFLVFLEYVTNYMTHWRGTVREGGRLTSDKCHRGVTYRKGG